MSAVDTHDYTSKQTRLFLEEVCCDLFRFEHAVGGGLRPEQVRVDREVHLGAPAAFADIRVAPEGQPAFFVEVKTGHRAEDLVPMLRRKYGPGSGAARLGSRVTVIVSNATSDIAQLLSDVLRGVVDDAAGEIEVDGTVYDLADPDLQPVELPEGVERLILGSSDLPVGEGAGPDPGRGWR